MRVGIDEAGKGPVLGPMVAAAVAAHDRSAVPDGVADSKTLTAERREDLAARLHADDAVALGVATVGVERIDDPETDMNSLTVAAHAEALAAVRRELDGQRPDDATSAAPASATEDAARDDASPGQTADLAVLSDAGDTSEARFARRVTAAAPGDPDVAARHGADEDDPLVAAASVVAKVERDARVATLAREHGEVGSGYPSDPTTRTFLEEYVREHGRLPDCARESWQTCDDVLAAAEQSALGEF